MGNFGIVVKPKTAPGYAAVKRKASPSLYKLKALFENNREFTPEQRTEAARLLGETARKAFYELRRYVRNEFDPVDIKNEKLVRKSLDETIEKFQKHFGHLPPAIDDVTGAIDVDCAANTILQSMLFDELEGKTGAFDTRTHIIPAVKMGGETFVLDYRNHNLAKALTLREYLRKMAGDYKRGKGQLFEIAKDLVKDFKLGKNPKPEHFAPTFRYYGGSRITRAVAHYNLGITFDIMGETDEAKKHYLQAVELNPAAADALHELGTIAHSKGDFHEAEEWYKKSLEVQPLAVETKESLAKLYEDMTRTKPTRKKISV